ncbi:anaerobic ribonucleoside-triphosphate reductase activating protein [Candidatus Parcubacteria bacterium]|nr:anaerobic ribonucleoside-triphosphate reductase activating protein [Candidatus Parcubacteria bacterium]
MLLGGLQKFSLLDYPNHLSAIIFTQGCNFQCQFCYNPMLVVVPQKDHHPEIKEDDLFAFLKKRAGKLDAVVITGGEPTIHADLPEFIDKIKKLGYLVKLDTNGANPKMIKKLIDKKLINYIAMDMKAPKNKYEKIVGVPVDFNKIEKSVKIIMESGLPYEFRTTIVPGLLNKKDDIGKIAKIIKGADKWYLQQFKSDTDLVNKKMEKVEPYSARELEEMCEAGRGHVKRCEVR